MANSVDPDQTPLLRRLIWVYTVCPGLSVRINRIYTICHDLGTRKSKYKLRPLKMINCNGLSM